MKKYFLSLLVVFVFISANAQQIEDNENGTWATLVNKFKVTEKLYVLNVLQWRLVDDLNYTRIFIVEPSVNYKFTDRITAGVGLDFSNFSFVGIRPPGVDYEHRLQQMIMLTSKYGKVNMNQRFMFEERFLVSNNGDHFYANRFRYRIGVSLNILKFKNNKYLFGTLTDEVRIRFAGGVSSPNFDQNNFVVGLGYKLLENSTIHMGYGRNYYNAGNGDYWGDHIFNIMFSYNFDFTKKKFYK